MEIQPHGALAFHGHGDMAFPGLPNLTSNIHNLGSDCRSEQDLQFQILECIRFEADNVQRNAIGHRASQVIE